MKNFAPLLVFVISLFSQDLNAQCGNDGETTSIFTQQGLDSLSGCESFQGNLVVSGSDISSLEPLSSLFFISGDISIYETGIQSIASLENLMNAAEISIYDNQNLSECCISSNWQDAEELGSISSFTIYGNAAGCSSYEESQLACNGAVLGCTESGAVNYNPEATIEDGSCLNGIDLQVSVNTILNSLQVNSFSSNDDCLVAEGCITGTGTRKTLRFTTTISNYGNEDFIIGYETSDNSQFYFDDCHGHYHYEGYANYQVFNYPSLLASETIGHKNGWCVMDLGAAVSSENPGWNTPGCSFTYGCSYMGISAGCSDTYSSGISCQWVDITDLADGEYVLGVSTNMETENYSPTPELDFSNNVVYVLFEIETNEQGATSVVSATEFDGSSINNICSPSNEVTELGFNFSESTELIDGSLQIPNAFLNEYYTESAQLFLNDTISLNGASLFVDSLVIDSVYGLPEGVTVGCYPQSCSFLPGNSCIGITGIPVESGTFDISITALLHFSNDLGENFQVLFPYAGGNTYLDGLLASGDILFPSFSPTLQMEVEIPIYGCTDTMALNFNPLATFENGSCLLPDLGCTDPLSLNFDETANVEDGSCEYCAEGLEWVVQIELNDSYGDGWNGNSYYVVDEWQETVATGTLESGYTETQVFCLAPGCYMVNVPNEGNYAQEISWEISAFGFDSVGLSGGCPSSQVFSFLTDCSVELGCMDTLACNYDPEATFDNGSCDFPETNQDCFGVCINDQACNFGLEGECYFATETQDCFGACPDSLACNFGLEGECVFPQSGFDCDGNCMDGQITTIEMYDSYGDGWNGNNYYIFNLENDFITQGTLASGFFGQDSLCLQPGCYFVSVLQEGGWPEEITWEIQDSSGTLLNGECPAESIPFSINYECNLIYGCADSLACNFNPETTFDNGSCEYALEGLDCDGNCTDLLACNYGIEGECYYETDEQDCKGYCTNPQACNYDSIAICDFAEEGLDCNGNCNDTLACNYGIDGVCTYTEEGLDCNGNCNDTLACNYGLDGTCTYTEEGLDCNGNCNDTLACNYGLDGDCTFAEQGFDCEGDFECSLNTILITLISSEWAEEISWEVETIDGEVVFASDALYENNNTYIQNLCLDAGSYLFIAIDSYGDGWNGSVIEITAGGEIIQVAEDFTSGNEAIYPFDVGIQGCTDSAAINYDPEADFGDNSCEYECICPLIYDPVCGEDGVSYSNACLAECEEISYVSGECEVLGCIDPASCTYDSLANTDDGSCLETDACGECGGEGPDLGFDCEGNIICDSFTTAIIVEVGGGQYDQEITWSIGGEEFEGSADTTQACLQDGCFAFNMFDSFGDGWNEATVLITDSQSNLLLEGTLEEGGQGVLAFAINVEATCYTGCTDSLASNYDPQATIEDASLCEYLGCTNSLACNYNINALDDDGTCITISTSDFEANHSAIYYGQTYEENGSVQSSFLVAFNEDGTANYSDQVQVPFNTTQTFNYSVCGEESPYIYSDSDDYTGTWNAETNIISGIAPNSRTFIKQLAVYGCMDELAINYDSLAVLEDNSCEYIIGCTDSVAENYNSEATVESGTCFYVCDDNENMVVMNLLTDNFPAETSWELSILNGESFFFKDGYTQQQTLVVDSVCVPGDEYITFNIYDTYGDGLTYGDVTGQFQLYVCGLQVFSGSDFGASYTGTFIGCDGALIPIFGCTDSTAINYNLEATIEDNTCEYEVILGCLDQEAVNYNPLATDDDGSCDYINCSQDEMLVEVLLFGTDGNGWGSIAYQITTFDGSTVATGSLEDGFEGSDYLCLEDGCYIFSVPENPSKQNLNWSIIVGNKKQLSGTSGSKQTFGVEETCIPVEGCTDATATNYNPLANLDDGSCEYPEFGSQRLEFLEGWNLNSSYIQAENMNFAELIDSLTLDSNLVIAKNNSGDAYLPLFGYNGIGEWDNTQGYQFKLNSPQSLDITGIILQPENTPISLIQGWNMFAYLRVNGALVDQVFSELSEEIIIVKNNGGLAYLPAWGYNGIGDLLPGQGYQMKINSDNDFLYNANDVAYPLNRTNDNPVMINQTSKVDFDKNTGRNMHIIIPELVWAHSVSSQDEVYIYDAQGTMVGAAKVTLPNTVITLWGDDLYTSEKDGLYDAEEWNIGVYSTDTRTEKLLSIEYDLEKSVGFEQDAVLIASQITIVSAPNTISLFNAVPNPANQTTEIKFYISQEQEISLRLYNVLGEELKEFSRGIKQEGYHSIEVDLNEFASGTYFYQLQSSTNRITKHLEVIK